MVRIAVYYTSIHAKYHDTMQSMYCNLSGGGKESRPKGDEEVRLAGTNWWRFGVCACVSLCLVLRIYCSFVLDP